MLATDCVVHLALTGRRRTIKTLDPMPLMIERTEVSDTSSAALSCVSDVLQAAGQKHHDKNDKYDSADTDPPARTIRVIAAATAEQQKYDQNPEQHEDLHPASISARSIRAGLS
jgi:hypothetical protein